MPSGRKKGGTNKYWNAEEKEKILYEKRHSAEEKVDKIEEEVADEQERILD